MRHNKAINHLGRKSGHRKALLSNMANSLILHKRITTTVAKAKALKSYVEPLSPNQRRTGLIPAEPFSAILRTKRLSRSSSESFQRKSLIVQVATPACST